MPVCAQCGQANPDIAKFCLACGSPLAAPAPVAEERKLITVLFCDIVSSTAKAEHMDRIFLARGRADAGSKRQTGYRHDHKQDELE